MKINYNELTRLAEIVRVARRGLGRLALASLRLLRSEEARVRDVDVLVAHVKIPGPYQRLEGAVRKRRPRRPVRRIDLSDERCKQGNTSVTLPMGEHMKRSSPSTSASHRRRLAKDSGLHPLFCAYVFRSTKCSNSITSTLPSSCCALAAKDPTRLRDTDRTAKSFLTKTAVPARLMSAHA
jgi:hypothetical protein